MKIIVKTSVLRKALEAAFVVVKRSNVQFYKGCVLSLRNGYTLTYSESSILKVDTGIEKVDVDDFFVDGKMQFFVSKTSAETLEITVTKNRIKINDSLFNILSSELWTKITPQKNFPIQLTVDNFKYKASACLATASKRSIRPVLNGIVFWGGENGEYMYGADVTEGTVITLSDSPNNYSCSIPIFVSSKLPALFDGEVLVRLSKNGAVFSSKNVELYTSLNVGKAPNFRSLVEGYMKDLPENRCDIEDINSVLKMSYGDCDRVVFTENDAASFCNEMDYRGLLGDDRIPAISENIKSGCTERVGFFVRTLKAMCTKPSDPMVTCICIRKTAGGNFGLALAFNKDKTEIRIGQGLR